MSQAIEIRPRGFRARFAILGMAVALALLGTLAGLWIAAVLRPARALVIEPASVDLTGTVHREKEPVRARFRLTNTLDRPVDVKELGTSCSCTTSLVEDGKKLPFTIEPGAAVDFWLEDHPIPQPGLIQAVRVAITAECDGRPLPVAEAVMRVLVDDPPKANPSEITIGDARVGEHVRSQFFLTTVSAVTKMGRPEIRVSDPATIRAKLVPFQGPTGLFEDDLKGHYRIDVELVRGRDVESITGFVDVKVDGRDIRVPVHCTFRRPYRLSQKVISLDGRSGEKVAREIYYEAHAPGWEEPELVSAPPGVELAIKPFDPSTRILSVRGRVPDAGARPSDQVIILRPRGRDDRITIPIRYGSGG